jgi:hypothetical protein
MNHNSFLKEFLEMRKGLSPSQPATANLAAAVLPQKGTRNKKKPSLTQTQKVQDGGLMHITENKPPKKEVIEYLQKRANELTVEKMA